MKGKERIIKTLNHNEPDRVPLDIGGARSCSINIEAYKNLVNYLGMDIKPEVNKKIGFYAPQIAKIDEKVYKKLGVDVRPIFVNRPSNWELDIKEEEDHYWYMDEFKRKFKKPTNGHYFDRVTFPLADTNIDDYVWPDPTDSARFKDIEKAAKKKIEESDAALVFPRGPGNGFLQMGARMYGYERWFTMLGSGSKDVDKFLDKYLEFKMKFWGSLLDKVGQYLEVICELDDLGTQTSQWLSLEMYRKYIKPYQRKLFDYIKSKADVKIFFHCDGAINPFIPELIDVGIDILNPIQYSCIGMNPGELKKEFGKDLVFWGGGIDTQKILPRANRKEVKEEVKKRINDLAPGGGFVFAAIHHIQPEVPPENIVAMVEAVKEYGRY